MALCHECVIDEENNNKNNNENNGNDMKYSGQSPDEITLIEAA